MTYEIEAEILRSMPPSVRNAFNQTLLPRTQERARTGPRVSLVKATTRTALSHMLLQW